jgi:hypothetical protein
LLTSWTQEEEADYGSALTDRGEELLSEVPKAKRIFSAFLTARQKSLEAEKKELVSLVHEDVLAVSWCSCTSCLCVPVPPRPDFSLVVLIDSVVTVLRTSPTLSRNYCVSLGRRLTSMMGVGKIWQSRSPCG